MTQPEEQRTRKFYVWSGSLKGVAIKAETTQEAVEKAVRANLPCVLYQVIRVSLRPQGLHSKDVFFEAPYENQFPSLFNGELDVRVERVERR